MKIGCRSCGIHFPQDFKITLTSQCNYWGDNGMANISVRMKKKFWVWLFKMPCDELFIKHKLGIIFSINAVPVPKEYEWSELIPGYAEMTEEQQQQAQRRHYAAQKSGGGERVPDLSHLVESRGKSKAIN